ncbi:MFS transporter [Klebsiella pneumoniae]|uniref:MFS transporter n=1 Tax=Klebsiella pneumoniae TaxID=573 RepID=A0A939NJ54_KLEPN|nr:MFS transporter [Klebsiella pneumoniae]
MVISMAAVADVIPPANRGRYQGLFGGVFGPATVIGPLIGGFLVQHASRRWIFYINLPLGLFALLVIGAVFHSSNKRSQHQIDWLGAIYLSMALLCIILFTSEGAASMRGMTRSCGAFWPSASWGSSALFTKNGWPPSRLFAGAVPQPQLPAVQPDRLRHRHVAVRVSHLPAALSAGGEEATPTEAGLQLIPLMGGLLLTSIISGRIISRTGKYRLFPILGTLLGVTGMVLLTRITIHSPLWQLYLFTGVLGAGLGLVMQVLVGGAECDAGADVRRRHLRRDPVPLDWRLHRRGAVWRGVHARAAEQPATTAAGRRGAAAGNESGGGPAPARGYPPRLPRRLRRGDPRGVSDGGRHYGGGVCPLGC